MPLVDSFRIKNVGPETLQVSSKDSFGWFLPDPNEDCTTINDQDKVSKVVNKAGNMSTQLT